jgi:hypothetical protein
MKMPSYHPDTNHLEPYWLSDSPRGIRIARRSTPKDRKCFKDLNLQELLDGDGFIHYGTPRRNGYRFITKRSGIGRRALTVKELDRNFYFWTSKDFKRLRRTRYLGTSYESRVRPMLYRQGIRVCVRHNVVPCVELKSIGYTNASRVVKLMHPVALFMALYKLPYCLKKGQAVIKSGGQFAILAHGENRPDNLVRGFNYTEIWGRFK